MPLPAQLCNRSSGAFPRFWFRPDIGLGPRRTRCREFGGRDGRGGAALRRAERLHEGTITIEAPDTLWATDATEAWARDEGRCAGSATRGWQPRSSRRECRLVDDQAGRANAPRRAFLERMYEASGGNTRGGIA